MLEASAEAWALDQRRTTGAAAYAPRPMTETAPMTASATRNGCRRGRSIGRSMLEALLITAGQRSEPHASAVRLRPMPGFPIFLRPVRGSEADSCPARADDRPMKALEHASGSPGS